VPRNHNLHAGQVATPFTVLAEFQWNAASDFAFVFETYKSVADFNADGLKFSRLDFRRSPATGFGAANQALITQAVTLFLNEMGLGGRNFAVSEFQWFPLQKVLTLTAVKGEQHSIFTKRGADYDAFIVANAQLFLDLNAAAWTHAKANDAFLNSMAAV
jgi:hypothetical protein